MDLLFSFLAAVCILLLLLVFFLLQKLSATESELGALQFSKSSQSVRYGKMSEQFIPFTKDFPFSPEKFRFLGNPIDGIVFGDDKIIFAEFKAGTSNLSETQKKIKSLVESKKVEWFEYRLK